MKVEQIYTSCIAHAAYYIESNGEAAIFDPLREVQPYLDRATKDNAKNTEFDSEHLVDTINIPLNEINNQLAEFPKDKKFVLHCAGGYLSIIAGSLLKQRGYDNFVDVSDGFSGIKKTMLPKTNYVCPTSLL